MSKDSREATESAEGTALRMGAPASPPVHAILLRGSREPVKTHPRMEQLPQSEAFGAPFPPAIT